MKLDTFVKARCVWLLGWLDSWRVDWLIAWVGGLMGSFSGLLAVLLYREEYSNSDINQGRVPAAVSAGSIQAHSTDIHYMYRGA